MTVRKRILLYLLGFSVIPIVVSTIAGLAFNMGTVEDLYLDRIDSLARISAMAFDELLERNKSELMYFSAGESVQNYISTRMAYGDESDETLQAQEDLLLDLSVYTNLSNVFDDIVILDENGMVSITGHAEIRGTDLSSFDYYRRAIQANDSDYVFVSNVHPSLIYPSDPGRNIIALSRVLYGADNSAQGVLVAFVDSDVMAGFSQNISFGQTGIAFLIDSGNFILYHPEERFFNAHTSAPKLTNLYGRYSSGEIPDSGAIYDVMDSESRIYYYVVIPGEEMVLLLRQDYNEYMADIRKTVIFALAALAVTAAIAVYLAFKFSREFVMPILSLKNAFASGRAEGRYVVCGINTGDELEDMADGYNAMIQTLERQYEEISEEKALTEHIAIHDGITGLYNRTAFERYLKQELGCGKTLAVMFLDVDGFKQINDSKGHSFGDAFLYNLGRRIMSSKAEFDIYARVGGDEFLLCKIAEREEAEASVKILLEELRAPFIIDLQTVHVTASIGISMYPDDGDTVETLVKNADIAMYSAKNGGKNTYVLYMEEMQSEIMRHSKVTEVLRRCIEENEIALVYQPEVELRTRQIVAYEALMRINSAELGSISPCEFIPVAEGDSTAMGILGHWLLVEACRFARGMVERHGFDGVIAVNISAIQMRGNGFVEEILGVLEQEKLPARHLQIELTESIFVSNIDENINKLLALREKGVTIAIDDFGTHYSSFSYLMHLPLDVLKIDRSFLFDIETNDKALYINKAIIDVAHKLGLRVVAEGVETESQCGMISGIGCDTVQGYYFSRPLTEDEAADWHDRHSSK